MMKAVVVNNYGDVSVLCINDSEGIPEPEVGQIIVKNEYAGVNYIDTYQRSGTYPVTLPITLGREGAGTVYNVGASVDNFKVGDRVAYLGPASYAEYTAVNTKHVVKLPDSVNTQIGAACMLQGMTAQYLVSDAYTVQQGDFVLVPAAAGGTGSLICQLASARGAIVIALASTKEKLEIAQQNGAQHVINYTDNDDFVTKVMQITNGNGVKVVYDGVGKAIYKKALACLGKRGYYISFGNASGVIDNLNPFDLTPKLNYFMRPALFQYIETAEEFTQMAMEVLELIEKGILKIHVHHVYDLADVAQSHQHLESRKTTGKLLLKC